MPRNSRTALTPAQIGDIIEVEEGGLMTRYEICFDFGEFWSCKVLDHYYQSEIGTYKTVYKDATIWKIEHKVA